MRFGKNFKIGIIVLSAVLLMLTAGMTMADAGGFSGDSDYGGGSGDSSWSFDDGGGDWSSSDNGSFVGGLPVLQGGFGFMNFVIIAAIVLMIISRYKKSSANNDGGGIAPQSANMGIQTLRNLDPGFSESMFIEDVSNMYVKLQQAWTAKDWEPMRMLMTEALYSQFERQLEPYITNRQTNHVDRIAVLSANITGFYQDEANDIITVGLSTRIVDYVSDDATGNIIRGSNTQELFMTYEWTLIRSKGVITHIDGGETRTICKACGAPMLLKQSNRCEYCGTLMKSGEYDWVISNIRGISQQTGR